MEPLAAGARNSPAADPAGLCGATRIRTGACGPVSRKPQWIDGPTPSRPDGRNRSGMPTGPRFESTARIPKKTSPKGLVFFGAVTRIRTGDLILTKDALYLLSYNSKVHAPRRGHDGDREGT